jgi:hypothetical protein
MHPSSFVVRRASFAQRPTLFAQRPLATESASWRGAKRSQRTIEPLRQPMEKMVAKVCCISPGDLEHPSYL